MRAFEAGEFGLIARVVSRLASPPPPEGPGDDAAVVRTPSPAVVITTDLLVEGRHFRFDWSDPYDVGHKAAAQCLADVAAMGARPTVVVIGLACPASTPGEVTDGITDGLRDECRRAGAVVVGGDVVGSDSLLLAVTALGDLDGRAAVTRAGAAPGDLLVLAGTVGCAATGLELLRAGCRDGPLVALHRRPTPPYEAGPALAAAGATSMVDVSDGLLADVGHVATASGVVVEVDADALAAAVPGVEVRQLLTGGEDHGLLATVPPGAMTPPAVAVVGVVRATAAGEGPGVRVRGGGVPLELAGADRPVQGGFDHFRG
jgi:thiamine-monophosphate kinase